MIERGKYQSLTMINWNGFFARTFDIDNLVTTLSGGNGAGKSTTMAAFITALIPDQSLLHFRNTTEAGSSQASRDKGLFGKLQPGVCFAMLDVINSRNERVLFGVKLQQVAGRDKKVDIKPFVIQGLALDVKPTDILIESVSGTKAKVKQLPEIKQVISEMEGVEFKAFTSVVDYHSYMFEMGVLPKKLRNSGDRSKFYRLIEASLYGGISSAITRSLRDYLLPQNGGVKKAFQDMESALRENRLTLEAIKTTQADRDLFKHLLLESTNYVAADYMRHTNDRKRNVDQILSIRGALFSSQKQIVEQTQSLDNVQASLSLLVENESDLEQRFHSASDHLQLVHNAIRQKTKIERYHEDLQELTERLEEQLMVVEEANEQVAELEQNNLQAEEEVDNLKSQLANYQQALNVQQTRAVQYQQAVEALAKATDLLGNSSLTSLNASQKLSELKQQEQSETEALLALKHKLDVSTAATEQFEQGLMLLARIVGKADRGNAANQAKALIAKLNNAEAELDSERTWQATHRDLQKDLDTQEKANALYASYLTSYGVELTDNAVIDSEKEQQDCAIETAEFEKEQVRDESNEKQRILSQLKNDVDQLNTFAPRWIQANEARERLEEQVGEELSSSKAVMQQMQQLLQKEKEQITDKDQLAKRRDALRVEMEKLSSPGGAHDPRLKAIADTIGGVLLSEIYDDISLDDAPFFSAMYGPARHAVVVADISLVKDKLVGLDDCPEDLYLIEGDADAFDDTSFSVEEVEGAVCVQFTDRQVRYSRIPDMSLFGRAARDQRLQQLRIELDDVEESYAKVAFDVQKLTRLYQNLNQFVESHIAVVFEPNPESALRTAADKQRLITRQLSELSDREQQYLHNIAMSKKAHSILDALVPTLRFVNDDSLTSRLKAAAEKLTMLSELRTFVHQHKQAINQLEGMLAALETDPAQLESVEMAYREIEERLKLVKNKIFAVEEVCERRAHFEFSDSAAMLDKNSDLNEKLNTKLVLAEEVRANSREALRTIRDQSNQYGQVFASLKSAHQAKSETVKEFESELHEFGVVADENSMIKAEQQKELIHQQLQQSRKQKAEYEKTTTAIEYELKGLIKGLKKQQKNYLELRKYIVVAKSSWCNVLHLAKEHDVQRRLYRRDLAYKDANELRSMSDKSLGALRLAVADNETLRDALRASEDTAHPERKVLFYIAIYQHLKERIRQDIIHTDDPVEAIEEMEIELARLTEELTLRENRLAISSDSVANIIKKTITREQNRIRMLNQGLSNINFGQVKGVRLNVNIRESHQILLASLVEQQEQHKDLFENTQLTFSQAMAKLFKRVNPHIDMGQRSPQVLGEELLDYRNYLELSVEVNRGTDGWLQAESGALSTGEAIGTGQSILLMVIQSWEEESRRLRSKDIVPCRLLFLDEAARLDSKSISTLFELCARLDMQLLIAAPENISPEKGTTYKLIRKVFKDHEHVHVVGLKGFAQNTDDADTGEQLSLAVS